MNYDVFTIPLLDLHKRIIVKGISQAVKENIIDFKKEYPLETYNSIPVLKWDFINTNLKNKFGALSDRFKCIHFTRGRYKFLFLYDYQTKYLYSFMTEDTFKNVQDKVYEGEVHYLCGLASMNKGQKVVPHVYEEQLSMFKDDKDDNEEREDKIRNIIKNINSRVNGEIAQYVLIRFEISKYELVSVKASILNEDLYSVHEESWNEYIEPSIDILSNKENEDNQEDDEGIQLRLREEIIQNQDEITLNIKYNTKEKEEKQ